MPLNPDLKVNLSSYESEKDSIGLAAAIDQAAEAIVITDLDGSILYVNPAFTRVTGYGSREAIGQNPRVLKSGTQNPAYYRNLWETIRGGVTWKGELINRRKDGTTYTEEMTITPVRDSCGDIVRFIALKQDVSDRRAAEESVAADEKSPPGGMSPLPGPVRALGAHADTYTQATKESGVLWQDKCWLHSSGR